MNVPNDGTAVEIRVQEGFVVFFNEEGKLMIQKKTDKTEDRLPSYEKISEDLYKGRKVRYWNPNVAGEVDQIDSYDCEWGYASLYNCFSEAQVKRLMAFNKLQNIALYLNDGWKPDFNDSEEDKYYIAFNGGDVMHRDDDGETFNFSVHNNVCDPCYTSMVYFKTEELAHEAIGIMGEESLTDLFVASW